MINFFALFLPTFLTNIGLLPCPYCFTSADLLEVVIEGLTDCVFKEIGKALAAMCATMPGSQKGSAANFDASVFDALLIKARAYGEPTIFTTLELASKIVPATNWIADEDKTDVRNQGYVGIYKGVKVMVIPQSYEDETLTEKVIDPSYAWILTNASSVSLDFS